MRVSWDGAFAPVAVGQLERRRIMDPVSFVDHGINAWMRLCMIILFCIPFSGFLRGGICSALSGICVDDTLL